MKHPDPRIEAILSKLASPKLATIDLSLERVTALLARLRNPQDRLPPVVHVAGTNGKGSLIAYLSAILQAAGYRVHRYTSPHLVRFNERILLAGKEIEDDYLLELLTRVASHTEHHPVTFFEATTAAAFLAFAETPADIVLLETGLGGRLDATNMVRTPLLTAITPISMDHMEYLGNTIEAIAAEKAGIIKPNVACVVGPQIQEAEKVIERVAQARHAPLYRFGQEWRIEKISPLPNLAGEHQINNAAAAIACTKHLKGFAITDAHIAQGITHADWPARLQKLTSGNLAVLMQPESELWLDGGHNPAAGDVLAAWAKSQQKPIHLICGMLGSKDVTQFLKPLAPHVRSLTAVFIEGEPQSWKPEEIAAAATALKIKSTISSSGSDINNTIKQIEKNEKDRHIILVCGSLYLAGNILWQNNQTI